MTSAITPISKFQYPSIAQLINVFFFILFTISLINLNLCNAIGTKEIVIVFKKLTNTNYLEESDFKNCVSLKKNDVSHN